MAALHKTPDTLETELNTLLTQSGSVTIFGALTLGEIGSDMEFGFPEFHNAAVVCVAKSERDTGRTWNAHISSYG